MGISWKKLFGFWERENNNFQIWFEIEKNRETIKNLRTFMNIWSKKMTDVDAKKDDIEEVKNYDEGENEGKNNEDEETKIPENGSGDNNGSAKSPTEGSAGGDDEEKMDQECRQFCHRCLWVWAVR